MRRIRPVDEVGLAGWPVAQADEDPGEPLPKVGCAAWDLNSRTRKIMGSADIRRCAISPLALVFLLG